MFPLILLLNVITDSLLALGLQEIRAQIAVEEAEEARQDVWAQLSGREARQPHDHVGNDSSMSSAEFLMVMLEAEEHQYVAFGLKTICYVDGLCTDDS